MISLIAREFRDVHSLIQAQDFYFGIEELNDLVTSHEVMLAFKWPHSSGLKSSRFRPAHGLAKIRKSQQDK